MRLSNVLIAGIMLSRKLLLSAGSIPVLWTCGTLASPLFKAKADPKINVTKNAMPFRHSEDQMRNQPRR